MKKPSLLNYALSALLALPFFAVSSRAANYSQMVVFGDSLSDNGNLSTLVGPGVFSALDYDPFRATDGPTTTPASSIVGVTVEQLNSLLGLTPLIPALLGGSDYAFGYSTTDASGLDLVNKITPGTGAQLAGYLGTHPVSSSALYVVWAGANDLFGSTTAAGIQSAETAAISNLSLQIATLLSAGAKNILWFNLPDLSLTPAGFLSGPTLDAQLHDSSLKFRTDWALSIQQLSAIYPSATITGVDVYGTMLNLLSNPLAYGFTNISEPAQGNPAANPDQYLFWDTLHPTTKVDSILASVAFQQLQPVPEPSGSVYLGVALFGLILQRSYVARRARRGAIAGNA